MTGSRVRVFRRVLVGMLIVSTLVLSGCARPVRGQSMASAEAAINAVEGLSGSISNEGYYSGWVYNRWSIARVTLDSGYHVQDRHAMVVWLVQTLWSINEEKPNQEASATITFSDLREFDRWQDGQDEFLLRTGYDVSIWHGDSDPKITFSVQMIGAKAAGLGKWPGDPVTLPANLIVKIADE